MRALRARLAAIAPAPAARVRRRVSRLVSVRDRGDPARRRFAARRLRGTAVERAYGSAPAAVDGCAAPAPVRIALPADLARAAGASVETRGGAVSRFSRIAVVRPQADPSAGLLAGVYDHESDVAHSGDVRTGPAFAVLARSGAPLFSRRGAALLVAGDSTGAEPGRVA